MIQVKTKNTCGGGETISQLMISKHGAAIEQIKFLTKLPFTLVNIQTETDRQREIGRLTERERW